MNSDYAIITELKNKISELENQNRLLRQRLTEAGISFADIIENDNNHKPEPYVPNQGARINPINGKLYLNSILDTILLQWYFEENYFCGGIIAR